MNPYSLTLEGKDFRKRIDGMNFTLIKSFIDLENIHESKVLEMEKQNRIFDALSVLARVFNFDLDGISIVKVRSVVDLTKILGIYAEIFFRGFDLFVVLQLKGFFFIKEDAFDMARGVIRKASEEFDSLFRLTLVDIAQDFLVPVKDILPDPTNLPASFKFCFKHTCRNNFSRKGEDSVFTGIEIFAGRFKLIVYDKVFENAHVRNSSKRSYYENLFALYPNEPVSRVELRLKQEACKVLNEPFYNLSMSEDDFISISLKSLYRKHKLRVRKLGSQDNDSRRWAVHPNWEYLFNRSECVSQFGTTQADFLFTSPVKPMNEAISKLIDVMASSCPNYSQEEFLEALKGFDIGAVRIKAQQKIIRREKTQDYLKSLKERILPPKGQNLGMSITSPTRSNVEKDGGNYDA